MRKFFENIFGRKEEKALGDKKSLEEFLGERDIKHPKRETVKYPYDHTKKPSPTLEPKTVHFKGFDKHPNSETPNTGQGHKKRGGSGVNNQHGSPSLFVPSEGSSLKDTMLGPVEGDEKRL